MCLPKISEMDRLKFTGYNLTSLNKYEEQVKAKLSSLPLNFWDTAVFFQGVS